MPMADFTLKEAAVLAEVSEKAARHEIARGIALPERERVGKATRHRLGDIDVFFLRLIKSLPVELAVEDRRDLYALLRRDLGSRGRWSRTGERLRIEAEVPVELDTRALRDRLRERLRLYRRGRDRVVSRPDTLGGEPVFAGTRIPVRHVGVLAKKSVPLEDVLADYPALSEDDVAFARLYAELRPDPGRPRKLLELTRPA